MTIQGLRHTENFVTNQRPQNWREGIMRLEPNGMAPLFALTSMLKSQVTDDPVYHWWEKVMPTLRLPLTAVSGTGTSLTVAATGGVNNAVIAGLRAGMVVLLEQTGELVRLTADPVSGGTTIVVQRAVGAVVATNYDPAASGVNPNILVIGNGVPENSMPPTSINFDPVEKSNYTQIFRDTLSMSRTAQQTRLRTGDAIKEAKRECLQLHSMAIERSLFFGEKLSTTGPNGEPMRFFGGVIAQIAAGAPGNVIANAGTNVSMTILENWMELSFRFGANEKLVFCGNQFALQCQRIARLNSAYQFLQGQKEFGMDVSRFITPFGTWVLKTHPFFNQVTSGVNTTAYYALASWGIVLDMAQLTYRYLTGGDTQYQPKLQDNGLDGMQSGYLTECGIELHFPQTHFIIKGMGAGIAG